MNRSNITAGVVGAGVAMVLVGVMGQGVGPPEPEPSRPQMIAAPAGGFVVVIDTEGTGWVIDQTGHAQVVAGGVVSDETASGGYKLSFRVRPNFQTPTMTYRSMTSQEGIEGRRASETEGDIIGKIERKKP